MSHVKSTFANGHGAVVDEDRKWENAYRSRWQHDKIVSFHAWRTVPVPVPGKFMSKNGLSPGKPSKPTIRTRPDLPVLHEPRGCLRGASYSWYVYSAQRVKYPMIRGRLMEMWREARKTMNDRRMGIDQPESGKSQTL
jgi:nitrate reductase alpha subunit